MKSDYYWLQLALEEFHRAVWLESLQKFVLDTDSDSETFSYGEYQVKIEFPQNSDKVLLILSMGSVNFFISYSLCFPDSMPQLLSQPDEAEAVSITEDISELWKRDFFKLG